MKDGFLPNACVFPEFHLSANGGSWLTVLGIDRHTFPKPLLNLEIRTNTIVLVGGED